MSMWIILYEISPFVYSMWPLTFTCDLHLLSRSLALALESLDVLYVVESFYKKMKFVGSIEFEISTFVWRKLKSRHQ